MIHLSGTELDLREPGRRSDGTPARARPVAWRQNGDVLRLAGLRGEIHPDDVAAFIYPDRDYFAESARRDRENHHNAVHGPYETPQGLLGIVDMRPQLREQGFPVTDPAGPDPA